MEFKKELKRIKKAMIERKNSSAPILPIPKVEHEVLDECLCTDSQHHLKALYATEAEAKQQAKLLTMNVVSISSSTPALPV